MKPRISRECQLADLIATVGRGLVIEDLLVESIGAGFSESVQSILDSTFWAVIWTGLLRVAVPSLGIGKAAQISLKEIFEGEAYVRSWNAVNHHSGRVVSVAALSTVLLGSCAGKDNRELSVILCFHYSEKGDGGGKSRAGKLHHGGRQFVMRVVVYPALN